MIVLDHKNYVPVLHARIAEVRAFKELPEHSKDKILPVFVARPWPNAKEFARSIDRITEAVGDRAFCMDLDSEFESGSPPSAPELELATLLNPNDGFSAYYSKLAELDFAIPVFQLGSFNEASGAQQLARSQQLGRGTIVRFKPQHTGLLTSLLTVIGDSDPAGIAFMVDAGWRRDILQNQAWVLEVCRRVFDRSPEIPLIITGSSFPATFSDVKAEKDFDIDEKVLFNAVRSSLNARFFYGDWGSTRQPSFDKGVKRTTPRIDVPYLNFWRVFRSEKLVQNGNVRETYAEVAERIVSDPDWEDTPDIWGKYLLECTAAGLPSGIKAPITASSARINLHLYLQSLAGRPSSFESTDDPYID